MAPFTHPFLRLHETSSKQKIWTQSRTLSGHGTKAVPVPSLVPDMLPFRGLRDSGNSCQCHLLGASLGPLRQPKPRHLCPQSGSVSYGGHAGLHVMHAATYDCVLLRDCLGRSMPDQEALAC
ncbi:hypothetical protein Hamer_G010052 [Homarus americanus]|uniref:Uncharacterized protein n=1 Tax=Homarus americanus TaxID=6706 RepID=A0A8J5JJK1_HOMAM|nr:hypothetical protein Hamer_G010052 [Homarus americanus]